MKLEANLFASHGLIDDDELTKYIKEDKYYNELTIIFNVIINIFKLNEMYHIGYFSSSEFYL